MVQDTRKDPRAKVLTMTVRYKSATIDEFIEHHSHDVSRGGIFIKTPSPFPPGTLLKFEIRIAEDKAIIGGVGRVVWKRDASQSAGERPSGMGVKFLKIDETSRKVIDQIIDNKGDVPSAFEESDESAEAAPAVAPAAAPVPSAEAVKPLKSKKTTMLGLGAVGVPLDGDKEEEKPKEGGFFPKTDSEK
ncbi:MAG: TIGR02266 family protein, partial [Deltaproteobacteria bacterium HGW-Deltaproteobacteria-20]